ncbi:MAG: flavin reductase family protein [Thermodesulfobacteriota bacterium]|nr:flavin reductase family protein [Thermodesulfobacteriota bacterium]
MEKAWLQAFEKMTYGIYCLTTSHGDKINGMIASWVSQVSYDPPMIMVAVHPTRYSNHLIRQSGCFALNILARSQTDLLGRFKHPDPVIKFSSIQWMKGKKGCPILKDCVAYMECEVKATYRPGNHTLFIGEVEDAQIFSDSWPLRTSDYAGVYLGRE